MSETPIPATKRECAWLRNRLIDGGAVWRDNYGGEIDTETLVRVIDAFDHAEAKVTRLNEEWIEVSGAVEARAQRAERERDGAVRAVRKYHRWLERVEELRECPNCGRKGYIGLDHEVGENVYGCEGCSVVMGEDV